MQSKNRSKKSQLPDRQSFHSKHNQLSLKEINTSLPKGSFNNQDDQSEIEFNKRLQNNLNMSCIANLDSRLAQPQSSSMLSVQQSAHSSNHTKTLIGSKLKSILKISKRNYQSKDGSAYEKKLIKSVKYEQNKKNCDGMQQIEEKEYFSTQMLSKHLFRSIDGVFLKNQQLVFYVTFKHRKNPSLKRATCCRKDLQWLQQFDKQQYILPFFLGMLKNDYR